MGEDLGELASGVDGLLGETAKTAAELAIGGGAIAGEAVAGAARDEVAAALESNVEEFLWNFAQDTVDGTQVVFHLVIDLLLEMTAPQITGEFIYTMGGRLFYLSLPLIVLFAVVRIIVDSTRARALAGAQAAFLGAGASVLGTVALLPVTALAVRAMDAAADGLLTATLRDGDDFVDKVMSAVVQFGTVVGNMVAEEKAAGPVEAWAVPASGAMATAIICVACVTLLFIACLIVGFALIARNMLLYLVTVTGPVCLSGLAWEPTRKWASVWLGWMVALIFTKLAIVVALGLGVLSISTPWTSDGSAAVLPILATVLAGIFMVALAALTPVGCFALFGFMGEAGVRELSNAAGGAQGALKSVGESSLHAGQSAKDRLGSALQTVATGGSSPGLVSAPGGGGGGDGTGSGQPTSDGTTDVGGSGGRAAGNALENAAAPEPTTAEADGENAGVNPEGAGSGDRNAGTGDGGASERGGVGEHITGEHAYDYGDGAEGPAAEPLSGPDVPGTGPGGSDVPYSWEQPGDEDSAAPGPVDPLMDPPVADPTDEGDQR